MAVCMDAYNVTVPIGCVGIVYTSVVLYEQVVGLCENLVGAVSQKP